MRYHKILISKMAGKKVLLTLNTEMYAVLEEKAKANLMTMQELITDTLRKSILLSQQPVKKSKAGRPPKVDEPFLDYFSRKR